MYEDQMEIAFAGMKADAGDDRVESFAVGETPVPFGSVVGSVGATGDDAEIVVPGAGVRVRGISVHSHTAGVGKYGPGGIPRQEQFDCASVMTRGLVWARATGAVTLDGPVSFNAQGQVSNTGTPLPNAVFRSVAVAVTSPTDTIALVELHNPFSETDTVPEP